MSDTRIKDQQIFTRSLQILTISVVLIGACYEFSSYSKEILMTLSVLFCTYSVYKQVNLFWLAILVLFFTDTEDFFYCFNIPAFIFGCALYFIQKAQGRRAKIEQDKLKLILDHLKYNLSENFYGIIQDGIIKQSSDSFSVLVESVYIDDLKNNILDSYWDFFKNVLNRCITEGESSILELKSNHGSTYEIYLDKIPWENKEAVLIIGSSNENAHFAFKNAGQMILHNMSHDLNTPLNIVSGVISDLMSYSTLPLEIQAKLRIAYNSSEVLSDMITYLLELSQMSLYQTTPSTYKQFYTIDILNDATCQADLHADSRDNTVQCLCDESLNCQVWGDSQCIKQVVSRVLFLSYSHTHKSKIKIHATRTHKTQDISHLHIEIKFPFKNIYTLQDSISTLTKACYNYTYLRSLLMEKDIKNAHIHNPELILDAAVSLSLVRAKVSQSGGSMHLKVRNNKLKIMITMPIADTKDSIIQHLKFLSSVNSPGLDLSSFEEFPDGEFPKYPSYISIHPSNFSRRLSKISDLDISTISSYTHLPQKFNTVNSFSSFENRYQVLLVDDSQFNRQVLQSMLMRLGFQMMFAENGLEALNMYQRFHDDINCILMDCDMPIMNGIESARHIRNYEKTNKISSVPIIAVTADVLDFNIQECYRAGMSEFCTKPIDIHTLEKILSKYFK